MQQHNSSTGVFSLGFMCVLCTAGVLAVDDCVPTGDCLTVAEAAQCNGLTTFLDAVEIAGLTEVVNDPDAQLTIFAPTNGAFEAILGNLGLSVEYLQFDLTFTSQVLKYHVLPTPETKESLLKKKELSTVLGQNKLCGLPSDLKFKKVG